MVPMAIAKTLVFACLLRVSTQLAGELSGRSTPEHGGESQFLDHAATAKV
ncbi:hypothetical protein D082_31790 [Synechocystis sp. PCC 6714]|nr:hypothetical protein D082_31790 [Synechocystis sp. PCC 6714]